MTLKCPKTLSASVNLRSTYQDIDDAVIAASVKDCSELLEKSQNRETVARIVRKAIAAAKGWTEWLANRIIEKGAAAVRSELVLQTAGTAKDRSGLGARSSSERTVLTHRLTLDPAAYARQVSM